MIPGTESWWRSVLKIPCYPNITAFINDQNRIKKLKENNLNSQLKLKDLKPGDEFEYVTSTRAYRQGRFLILDKKGSYLESAMQKDCVFIFSYTTNKICQHWGFLNVNLISKTKENNMENKMGHFIDWKFGVPVKVATQYQKDQKAVTGEVRLVYEDSTFFVIVHDHGGHIVVCNKQYYNYELIPHKYTVHSPRYSVCQNGLSTAFCNANGRMLALDATQIIFKPYPTATSNIDGKVIELSDETVAELKKKLGI